MRVRLALHRVDKTEIIHQRAQVRDEFGNHFAGLAARAEFPGTFRQRALSALEGDELFAARQRRTMAADEFRFVVEGVELAAGAAAKDHQHVLRARREVRRTRRIGVAWVNDGTQWFLAGNTRGEQSLSAEQVRQRNGAKAERRVTKKAAAIQQRTMEIGNHANGCALRTNTNVFSSRWLS